MNARAAATRAQGAAERSRSAAASAQAAYTKTQAAAATAHAAAAEAIDASQSAKDKAKKADAKAKEAQAAAITARKEATAAVAEAAKTAAWAAKTAGYALATAQYAQGARDAANTATKAGDEAVTIGSPYRESDTSAAYAVLIGQTAKTMAEQQASAAKAKSDEAKKAAAQAKALAEKAAGDAKIALQAAAYAADYAVQAVASAAAANASATAAATDAAAAKKADANAQKYDQQAGTDAFWANSAANDAESAAAQADRDATAAEKDATSARSAATTAENAASAADKVATRAESDAGKAEKAASNADAAAKEADAAATRAEEEERKRLEELRKEYAEQGPDPGPDLSSDEEAALLRMCGQECVDEYRSALALASLSLLEWVKQNGGQILLDEIGWTDLKNCLTKGDVEACLWTLAKAVPASKIVGVGKAIVRIASGVVGFFEKSAKAKKTLDKLRKLADKAKKEPELPPCEKKKPVTIASAVRTVSFAKVPSAAASGDDEIDLDVCDFNLSQDLPYEVLADIEKKYGSDVADGVEYQWMRMGSNNAQHAADHALPGINRNLKDMAEYFKKWRGKQTHIDTRTQNPVAYDEDKGLIIILQPHRIHAYKMRWETFHNGGRYEAL